MERWLPIPRFEGSYEVSNLGRVRSMARKGRINNRILKGMKCEYVTVALYKNKERVCYKVHHLVITTFKGPCPIGHEVRHLDDRKYNNKLSNLTYGTRHQNIADRRENGIWGNQKLFAKDVKLIRASSIAHTILAKRLGVTESTIRDVREYRSHKVLGKSK